MLPNITENSAFILLKGRVDGIEPDVAKHQKILIEGNGEILLVEKVRNHEAFIGSLKYWLKFVVGAIILQTIAFGTAAVIWFVKLMPILEELSKIRP